MTKIAFEALIKLIKTKSLVSGDKETEVTLRLQGENVKDIVLNSLNSLQRADEMVMVVIIKKGLSKIDKK